MFLPGLGGRLLSALGRRIGRTLDAEIGWSVSSQPKDGARLESFKVQDSRYGLGIPVCFGRSRLAGNVIWVSDLIETAHEETVSGGKGGVVGDTFSQSRTTYTYSLNCAIALCEGEIGGIQTIWADSKVIYENGLWHNGIVASATIHDGAEDQPVDPLLESWLGAGMTPAYRGVAYIVLEGLQLGKFGNRLPNMTFEIMPKMASQSPLWLGQDDPDIYHAVVTNRQGGMPPIVWDGGAVSARRMLVGGYVASGGQGHIEIIDYDVSGNVPLEVRREQSPAFACVDVGDHCWAVSPDKRMIAIGVQDGSSGYPYHVMLFDTLTRSFGPVTSFSMLNMEVRQLAWLDAYNLAVSDCRDTRRGVRVLARAGLALNDRGFYDVWGSGSASTRFPVAYTQFMPFGDGLITMTGNQALAFTSLYGRAIAWKDNALSVGEAFAVSSGYNPGSGSGPQITLHRTGDDEWTLCYLTLIDMQMMSFVPSKDGVTVTRPWQKFMHEGFAVSATNNAVVIGGHIAVLHRPSTANAYYMSEFALDSGSFRKAGGPVMVEGVETACTNTSCIRVDSSRLMVLGNVGSAGNLGQIGIVKRRDTSGRLSSIVAKLLSRCGYKTGDYELSALDDVVIEGYALSEQTTASGAIEQLMLVHPFDLIETDGQLKAVLHGAGDEVAVAEGEAADSGEGEAFATAPVMETRTQELDLPVELRVDYIDAARDYEVGSQKATRYASNGAVSKAVVEVPVVMSGSDAKKLAARHLYGVWLERERYRVVLSRAYAALNPADILSIADRRVRVVSVTHKDGLVSVDGIAAIPVSYGSKTDADSGVQGTRPAFPDQKSYLYLMDLPLLRAEDDKPGFYVAASGTNGWKGATLWRGDEATSFARVTSFSDAATSGVATSVLGEASPHVIDEVNEVYVQLLRGGLSSCSTGDLLNGANAALLGAEIIQFRTATLVGPGYYRLSGFLRGRKGTEGQMANHQVGENFVLLSSAAIQFLPVESSERGVIRHYRAATYGASIDEAQDIPFACGLATLSPLPPVHLRGYRPDGPAGDLVISWIRRSRKPAPWVDYVDAPLDQEAEAYDVEIMDGGSVMRSYENLTSPFMTYTAAQQAEDWGVSLPQSYEVKVYQRSTAFGRGGAAQSVL
jgi:hypothetical protein